MHVELLISLVQERRAVYDPSDPMHRNRDVIAALWTDIATEMKCKGKFNSFYWTIIAAITVEITWTIEVIAVLGNIILPIKNNKALWIWLDTFISQL